MSFKPLSQPILDQQLLTLEQAAARLPGRPHVSTVARWTLHGIRGVRLPSIKVGGRRFIDERAIASWIAATQAAPRN
jgi:hypothetical protein